MPDKIRIGKGDLYSTQVNDFVAAQEALARGAGELGATSLLRRILLSSLFFLAVAGGIGGFIGWAVIEPYFNEGTVLWGEIESVDRGSDMIRVKGIAVLVSSAATRISGRGEYEDVNTLADLEEGLPVRIDAMLLGRGQFSNEVALLATRLVAQEISEELRSAPPPDLRSSGKETFIAGVFAFAIVGASIAGLIAAADGLVSRNLRRGLLCGLVGTGLAIAGGLVSLFPAGILMTLSSTLVSHAMSGAMWTSESLSGMPLMILIVGRSLTWGVVAMAVGLGQGVALRNKKLALNGFLGGMLGGLLGGMLFEPILQVFADTGLSGQATLSRLFGFAVVGVSAGLMIGLVEFLSKDSWLLMRSGPLAGKQFVVYKTPTHLGSSPKCDIYLFKDPDVEPRHAALHKSGNRIEIEDLGTPAGTYVNKQKITRRMLEDGDVIMIGQTTLQYAQRSRTEA